jgi:hypothetical protein
MDTFEYTVTSEKPFEEAVLAIEKKETGLSSPAHTRCRSYSGRKGLST